MLFDSTFVPDTFTLVGDLEGLQALVNQNKVPEARCPDCLVRALDQCILRYDSLAARHYGMGDAERCHQADLAAALSRPRQQTRNL